MSLRKKTYDFISIQKKSNYGFYLGSFKKWNTLIWNIIFPERLISRFKGKTLFRKKFDEKYYKFYNNFDETFWKDNFKRLNDEGCVIIEKYFSNETIDKLKIDYNENLKLLDSKLKIPENKRSNSLLQLKESLTKIWLDKNLIGLMKNFSSDSLYARNYPIMSMNKNFNNQISSRKKHDANFVSKYADDWHVDHSNLLTLHIILEDLSESDTCMEFLPESHKHFNQTYLYSDEEVKNFKKAKKCYGKKGSIYIHYGNVIHRMSTKENSSRIQLHLEFTSKTNILMDVHKISKTLNSDNADILEGLDSELRDVCRGLYPLSYTKGYNVLDHGFTKSSNAI